MSCNAPHQVTEDVRELSSPATLWIAIVALLRESGKILHLHECRVASIKGMLRSERLPIERRTKFPL